MTDKIGALIIDVSGTELQPEERELLAHPLVGGVILFARNYAAPQQLRELCEAIRASRRDPLIISVDQEGGRVQRFIDGFTRIPSMGYFGRLYDKDKTSALQQAKDCGWLMAVELLACGIDMSLAPVLDLNKGVSEVIGERAFHARSEAVIQLATAFVRGMREAGMASTGKHFPGHGSVALDSHLAMPVDTRSYAEIENDDLVPFKALIKSGINAMMAAHIVFPEVDKQPVGFSSYWLKEILRQRLGFSGTIFSDDLNMEGANISGNYADRVVAARDAGCDFALLCNNRQGVIQVLDNLSYVTHMINIDKWGALQGRCTRFAEPLENTPRWRKTRDVLLRSAH